MAKIRIHNMMFYGFHGFYEYEREQGQKFFIDVELETKTDQAVESDDIKDAVDTAVVYGIVKDVTENKRFQLLMALGGHIADRLLQKFSNVKSATVCIRKPSVPISGPIDYVEVETTRTAE